MNYQRVMALLTKEFGQLFKDKKLLPLVFVAPVLQLTFMGFAASLDVKNISVVLCDLDKTEASRDLMRNSPTQAILQSNILRKTTARFRTISTIIRQPWR